MKKISNFTTKETRFLSNFYPHKKDGSKYPLDVRVLYNGIVFDCVENAYQASKFTDKKSQERFACMSPYETKDFWLFHDIENKDFESQKLKIMEDLVFQKFSNSNELRKMLLKTGDAILEEGNNWGDTFWGICDDVGQNNLGKILMRVRNKLRKQD